MERVFYNHRTNQFDNFIYQSFNFNLYQIVTVTVSLKIIFQFMLKRKSPVQTDRKKKVSLPAALFNRSPLKNAENSSMISNTSFANDPPCQNHPNKKGKYTVVSEQIEEDELTFYCQKCAILLASKGFEVKKLENSEIKPPSTTEKKKSNPRELELNNFVKTVQQKTKLLKENKKHAAQQLSQIQEVYEEKVRKIEQFFQEIYLTLQKHKNNQVHDASLRKKSTEEELATYLGYVTEKVQLLETMKQDIDSSHESIVSETPEADYQLVMSHYQKNLSEIKIEPINTTFTELNLPQIDSIEAVLCEVFEGGRSGPYFSFDSSKKVYNE